MSETDTEKENTGVTEIKRQVKRIERGTYKDRERTKKKES